MVDFDERKFVGMEPRQGRHGPASIAPPPNATPDEAYLLEHWGMQMMPNPEGRLRVLKLLVPNGSKFECFDLWKKSPVLFREVASAQTTVEEVTALADQYGPLLGSVTRGYADYIDHWYALIRAMRRAVAVWEKARSNGDDREIKRLLRNRAGFKFGTPSKDPGTPANVDLGDENEETRIRIRPSCLADALWLELALAVGGKQNLGACAECGTWFAIAAGAARSDKLYCSDACKMRAYRKRKKDAS